MSKLILVNTGGSLFEEAPSTAAVNRWLPVSTALFVRQLELRSIVFKAGTCEVEYRRKSEAEKVVAPFIYPD
jgi:hypothetical protein